MKKILLFLIFMLGFVALFAQVKFESEDAQLTGLSIITTQSGYSGTGYVDPNSFDSDGDKVSFTVNAPSAGSYPLTIGYGGFHGEKYQFVIVNGSSTYTLFPESTGFVELNYGDVQLNAGDNIIEISKSWGWTAIDYITISGLTQTDNLLNNGNFSNGTTDWDFLSAPDADFSVSNGEAVLNINSSGTQIWEPQLVQNGFAISNGTSYTLTFDARAASNRTMQVFLSTGPSNYTAYVEETVNLTSGMQSFSYTFTAGTSDSDARLDFNMGGGSNVNVIIDNVTLTESDPPQTYTLNVTATNGSVIKSPDKAQYNDGESVTLTANANSGYQFDNWSGDASGTENPLTVIMDADKDITANISLIPSANNMLSNGYFSNGTTDWDFLSATDADFSVSNGEAVLNINSSGTEVWEPQLVQNGFAISSGASYTLTFDARAASSRTIQVYLSTGPSNYTAYLEETVNLTSGMQSFSYSFTAGSSDSDARLDFNMGGGSNVNVIIDNVILTESDPPQTSSSKLGTNFWNIGWGIWDDCFVNGTDFSTTSNPWNPTFLSEMSIYSCIRPMDWVSTNNSNVTSWSQRVSKTSGQTNAVAYEWQIDLCNRLGVDLWTTIPAKADNDYIRQLATLIKNNLNPNLKVYIEYSNETWNYGFSQADYCSQQGAAMGLPGDYYEQGFRYHAVAAINVWRRFEEIYGAEMSSRVVKVLAGQDGNSWLSQVHINTIESSTWNPTGIWPDAYAVAPYIGHSIRGDDPQAIDKLIAEIPGSVSSNVSIRNFVASKGIDMFLAYEGGQHIADYSGGNGSHIANRDPEMYDFYTQYLNAYENVFDVFMHYCHTGSFDTQGCWGALEYTGQPLSQAHKYRALVDWSNATASLKSATTHIESESAIKKTSFSIYPNPAFDAFVIKTTVKNAEVLIIDVSGKVVYQSTMSSNQKSINTSDLVPGLYIISLKTGNNTEHQKLIIK